MSMAALKNKEGGGSARFLASLMLFSAVFRFLCLVEGFLDLRGILGVRSGLDFRVVEGFGVLRLLETN